MNYSLETFNEASVGGWLSLEKGVVLQVRAAAAFPKEETSASTPLPHLSFTPFQIFIISLIHLSIQLHPPTPAMFPFLFSSALFPQHSPILIMNT